VIDRAEHRIASGGPVDVDAPAPSPVFRAGEGDRAGAVGVLPQHRFGQLGGVLLPLGEERADPAKAIRKTAPVTCPPRATRPVPPAASAPQQQPPPSPWGVPKSSLSAGADEIGGKPSGGRLVHTVPEMWTV
jgi:hypothetical protein